MRFIGYIAPGFIYIIGILGGYFGCALADYALDAPNQAPAVPLAAPVEVDIDGFFTFHGEAAAGEYGGVLYVERKGDSYLMRWFAADGAMSGLALREGDVLWCSYTNGQGGVGICAYKIELEKDKPRLVGYRGVKEVATWLKGLK